MKTKWNIKNLPVLVLGCGGVAGALWALMLKLCLDDKGLLKPWNFPGILILLLTLAVFAGVVVLTRPLAGSNRYGDNFGASLIGGISAFAAALGLLSVVLPNGDTPRDFLANARMVLGILSIPSLVVTGLYRLKGKRPAFLFHGILCIFFGLYMADQYRAWSCDPQIAHYASQLFASVFLALSTYFLAAFSVGMGRRLKHLLTGLMAAYFCLCCIGLENGLFYLTCGIWAAANLCDLQPRPRRRRPAPEPAAEQPGESAPPEAQI